MKLAYQVATPDVSPAGGVTAYQGDFSTSLERIKSVGYDGAELMVANPGSLDKKYLKQILNDYSLPVPMVCTGEIFGQDGLYFTAPRVEQRAAAIQRVKDAVDLAVFLGTKYVNIGRVRGGFSYGGDHEQERTWSLDGLRDVSRYADERDVIIALEPVNSIAATFINSTQDGLEILKELNEPALKLMLDSNHMFLDDRDELSSISDAITEVVYVHLADSNRLYPGRGKLDFFAFIETLSKHGYNGWLSVEVFQRPDQDTALQESFDYVKPILDRLDGIL